MEGFFAASKSHGVEKSTASVSRGFLRVRKFSTMAGVSTLQLISLYFPLCSVQY